MERVPGIQMVNTNVAVDNQSFTFQIPSNTSRFTKTFGTRLPPSEKYYRYLDSITYRIDTSGIYNIDYAQNLTYYTTAAPLVPVLLNVLPGYYDLPALQTLLVNVINPIPLTGAGAFLASIKSTCFKADFTNAPQILQMLGFITKVVFGPNVSKVPVDLTLEKDLMLIFCSLTRQSTENNVTNIAAIPISGQIGLSISGTQQIQIPLLKNLDSVDQITITIKKIDGSAYEILTPIFINLTCKFSIKSY